MRTSTGFYRQMYSGEIQTSITLFLSQLHPADFNGINLNSTWYLKCSVNLIFFSDFKFFGNEYLTDFGLSPTNTVHVFRGVLALFLVQINK